MFRRKPRRSPFRIDQIANWQVNELEMRMTVAKMIGPSGSRIFWGSSQTGVPALWARVAK
jgi:hypothetical protein